ncbi:NADH pyrophosphatase [Thecaphora frezii]
MLHRSAPFPRFCSPPRLPLTCNLVVGRSRLSSTLAAPRARPCSFSRPRPFSKMTTASIPTTSAAFPSFSTVNFYAGSKLNRLSWLRTSSDFLNSTISSSATRFVLLKHLDPLVHKGGDRDGTLATLSWDEIRSTIEQGKLLSGGKGDGIFGPAVYGLGNAQGAQDDKDFTRATDGLGPNNLALVFLGIDESELARSSLPGQLAKDARKDDDPSNADPDAPAPAGRPYFALSLTYTPPGATDKPPTHSLLEKLEADERYDFLDMRANAKTKSWPLEEAAIVAQAKSLIDWNERHQYCPACARRQYSLWSGYKRGCSSSLGTFTSDGGFEAPFVASAHPTLHADADVACPSTKVLSNFHYPRTDPVIIMAILSADGESVLLGRQKKWPKGFVSCLAGFCEPGESFEEAVRREVLEEAGVKVNQVVYHSSQPWPYPTNLMAGFFGIAEADATIRLDLDNELEEARFYTRQEILAVLRQSDKTLTRSEIAKMDEKVKAELEREGVKPQEEAQDEKTRPGVRLPPETAIARVLISAWARGDALLPHQVTSQSSKM